MNRLKGLIMAALLLAATSAGALEIAAGDGVTFMNPEPTNDISTGNWSLGWEFTPKVNTVANLLGFYDAGHDGLSESHQVGLFDINGNLLRSTTVTNADPYGMPTLDHPNDGYWFKWREMDQGPIVLTAGEQYVLAAVTGTELYTHGPADFTEHWATFIQARYHDPAGSGLLDSPNVTEPGFTAYFGPNIGAAVPEPSTFALLGLGAFALYRRRSGK